MKHTATERQGQQLVHQIGLLTRCLEISNRSASLRTNWEQDLLTAKTNLEALHAGGLDRAFMAVPRGAAVAIETADAQRPETPPRADAGLESWQRELVVRLERGLGRRLLPADFECITWNLAAGTMSVAAQPLLGELRDNNLTSNVFRRQRGAAAGPVGRR